MHGIGENIVYGSSGVMTIIDIREEVVLGEVKKYYVLKASGAHSDSLTFVPVDNERLVSMMRPLLTKGEILDILHSANDAPECEWVKDNRVRSERFKNILDSGDRARMISMIRSIYKTGQRRVEEGKKNYLSDENAMRKAEKLINSEFAIVLGIPEEQVPAFIAAECGADRD